MGGPKGTYSAEAVAALAAEIARSRKYGHVSADTLNRLAQWGLERYPPREALKKAKGKLHQICGAFATEGEIDRAALLVGEIEKDPTLDLRDFSGRILDLHSSTRERREFLEDLYTRLFALTGRPGRILDIGCGLHPFSVPFMGLRPEREYVAWDIDRRLVDLIARFFKAAGIQGSAECRDILSVKPEQALPTSAGDLVLLLKTMPTVEQERKGSALRLLDGFRKAWMLVSYPTVSIGGALREDMRMHYHAEFTLLADTLGLRFETMEFPTETFYLTRPASS